MTFNKTEYQRKYRKDKLKRISLEVQKEYYDNLKAAADQAGESVNGYIKKSVDMRMESESQNNTV